MMLVGLFFAVWEWSGPQWEYPLIVSLGFFFFGSFSLFFRQSILYKKDESVIPPNREKWKIVLEEYGIAGISALSILLLGQLDMIWYQIVLFGVFLFAFFLFAGKGFLGMIVQSRNDWMVARQNRAKSNFRKKEIQKLEDEMDEYKTEIRQLKELKQKLFLELKDLQVKAATLEEEKESRVAYFNSEFDLASAAKSAISNRYLSTLNDNDHGA
jgi:hypothetical protein